jgi:hypothetical protein
MRRMRNQMLEAEFEWFLRDDFWNIFSVLGWRKVSVGCWEKVWLERKRFCWVESIS